MALSHNLEEIILQTIRNDKPETIQQLITIVSKKAPRPRKDIIKIILKLQKEEQLALHYPYMTQKTRKRGLYLKTGESYWYWATVVLQLVSKASFDLPQEQSLFSGYPVIVLQGSFFPQNSLRQEKRPAQTTLLFLLYQ